MFAPNVRWMLPAERRVRVVARLKLSWYCCWKSEVAVLAHVQGRPELAGQHLERVPVEVVVEGLPSLFVRMT